MILLLSCVRQVYYARGQSLNVLRRGIQNVLRQSIYVSGELAKVATSNPVRNHGDIRYRAAALEAAVFGATLAKESREAEKIRHPEHVVRDNFYANLSHFLPGAARVKDIKAEKRGNETRWFC